MQNSQVGRGGESARPEIERSIFERGKTYSVEQVIELAAHEIYESARLLGIAWQILENTGLPNNDTELGTELGSSIIHILDQAEAIYIRVGIEPAWKQVQRIKRGLDKKEIDLARLRYMIEDLQFWTKDGFASPRFYHLSATDSALYHNVIPYGTIIAAAFPEITPDLQEAAKCKALGEYTACAFHLLRGIEAVVQGFAVTLDSSLVDKNDRHFEWHNLTDRIASEAKELPEKTDEEKIRKSLFIRAVDILRALKEERNSIMHARLTKTEEYTEERAALIWREIELFLSRVAELKIKIP